MSSTTYKVQNYKANRIYFMFIANWEQENIVTKVQNKDIKSWEKFLTLADAMEKQRNSRKFAFRESPELQLARFMVNPKIQFARYVESPELQHAFCGKPGTTTRVFRGKPGTTTRVFRGKCATTARAFS